MKAKFGAIVTDGRGKIGGHVASKNRSGSYFRTKVTPVNRNTAFQVAIKNRLAMLSQLWSTLTQAQRDAWNSAVSAYTKTNIFGDTVTPSGFNLFQKLNNNLERTIGIRILEPLAPTAIPDISLGALTAVSSTGVISMVVNPNVSDNASVEVYATAPMSAGKSFIKSEFRKIGQFESDGASPYVLTTMYATKFGAITNATGKKIFVKTVAIDCSTGQSALPNETSCLIS